MYPYLYLGWSCFHYVSNLLTLKGKHGTGHKRAGLDRIKLRMVKERQSYSSEAIARIVKQSTIISWSVLERTIFLAMQQGILNQVSFLSKRLQLFCKKALFPWHKKFTSMCSPGLEYSKEEQSPNIQNGDKGSLWTMTIIYYYSNTG